MKIISIVILFCCSNFIYCQDNHLPEYERLVDTTLTKTNKKFFDFTKSDVELKKYIDSKFIINEANQLYKNESDKRNQLDKKELIKLNFNNQNVYFWKITTLLLDKKYVVLINSITVTFKKNNIYINKTGGVSMGVFVPYQNKDGWILDKFEMIEL
jgi:hypothetical protein